MSGHPKPPRGRVALVAGAAYAWQAKQMAPWASFVRADTLGAGYWAYADPRDSGEGADRERRFPADPEIITWEDA